MAYSVYWACKSGGELTFTDPVRKLANALAVASQVADDVGKDDSVIVKESGDDGTWLALPPMLSYYSPN